MSLIALLALLIFLPFLLLAAYNTGTLISRAAGTPATIVVDTDTVQGPVKTDFYHAFAQGGEESTDMLGPVVGEVMALKPKLIRIDHIFDQYGVVGRSGTLTFDFERLDQTVDSILAAGAKPLFSLSYMPPVIAKDGNSTNLPNSWEEWTQVVQKTIEHYSGRAEKNISGVYYEVWNEPDGDGFGKWGLSGEKNYLTLYRYASIGASNADNVNSFSLGGPATTGLYRNWIEAMITSGNRIDFLSWHSYVPDPKRFSDDQRNLISWLLPYPGYTLVPKLITEFGFSGSKDQRYSGPYAAAYTAGVVRQLISGGPTYLVSFQLKDGPGQAGQGWGLIANEDNGKRLKPRYHVYAFLDAMAGYRMALTGEGTWVTGFATTDGNSLRVLLVNFDAEGDHSENVPVTFANLKNGTYVFRERFLLGRNVTFTETVAENTLTKHVFMPAQSVAIVELTKQ